MLHRRIGCWKMMVGRLAVWCWLLFFPLFCFAVPQNNTCYRVKTVEVRVAVPQQEPATFRSYTWCLKVPPRCSKYTVVMRERITYETEVRNETVSECCAGFVSLYDECVPACRTCTNMRCLAGNCTCEPGYIGPHCNQTCEFGKWGDRCSEVCICRVGEDCDFASGSCSLSTSTSPAPSTALPSLPTIISTTARHPSTMSSLRPNILTTPNAFINLTPTEQTNSAEDLTEFNVISRPRNNTLKISSKSMNGNDENSLNALGDVDYPILPTDSDNAIESPNSQVNYEPSKNIVLNRLSVNGSVVTDRWINELGAHSGVTLGSALGLLALLAVVVSAVVRCRDNKTALPVENTTLHLVAKNSHYAVPGPPSFSFINGYSLDLAREVSEDMYDHPRSARCLANNEPVYDELRY